MSRTLRPRYAVPATAALALALSGCTGSDDGGGADVPEAAEAAASSSADPSASPSASPSAGPSAQAPGAGTAYCDSLGDDLTGLFASVQDPRGVTRAMSRVRSIADSAPPVVADEWRLMTRALDDVEGALLDVARLQQRAAGGEISGQQLRRRTRAVVQQLEGLDTPRNARAGDRVARHAQRYCGLELAR